MITNQEEKLIRSLRKKKYRKQEQLFVIEGVKLLEEALDSEFTVKQVFATNDWVEQQQFTSDYTEISERKLKAISSLTSPPGVLALVEMPIEKEEDTSDLTLVLEAVRDPGNLGTIIRTADAFGIKQLVCSEDTVDAFSPKVVQASMGSIFRTEILYMNLQSFLKKSKANKQIYGATLEGDNVYKTAIEQASILVMGSESHGISTELKSLIDQEIKIPFQGNAESLNVSIATAILVSEFRRQFSSQ